MSAPLAGVRALVTRPVAQAEALCAAIRARGGEAIAMPLLAIAPVAGPRPEIDAVLAALATFEVAIFVSANAVRCTQERLQAANLSWPPALRCVAIGSATRAALQGAGIAAESGQGAMDSEGLLAHAVLSSPAGRRIVLLRGNDGRGVLAAELRARGAELSECVLYERRAAGVTAPELERTACAARINVILVASGETLEVLGGLLPQIPAGTIPAGTPVVVPGARVAELAARAGFDAVEIAANATDAAMLETLARIAPRLARTVEH